MYLLINSVDILSLSIYPKKDFLFLHSFGVKNNFPHNYRYLEIFSQEPAGISVEECN